MLLKLNGNTGKGCQTLCKKKERDWQLTANLPLKMAATLFRKHRSEG